LFPFLVSPMRATFPANPILYFYHPNNGSSLPRLLLNVSRLYHRSHVVNHRTKVPNCCICSLLDKRNVRNEPRKKYDIWLRRHCSQRRYAHEQVVSIHR
jgi:hypothetical protein